MLMVVIQMIIDLDHQILIMFKIEISVKKYFVMNSYLMEIQKKVIRTQIKHIKIGYKAKNWVHINMKIIIIKIKEHTFFQREKENIVVMINSQTMVVMECKFVKVIMYLQIVQVVQIGLKLMRKIMCELIINPFHHFSTRINKIFNNVFNNSH